jgi:phosphoglycerate kinase
MRLLRDRSVAGQTVVVREDFNVPLEVLDGGQPCARIDQSLKTICYLRDQGAAIILISHAGRPQEGVWEKDFSLEPVARYLERTLGQSILFWVDWERSAKEHTLLPGEIALCENIRFSLGESSNDAALAQRLASLGDLYVMDAFAAAHRAHASTEGVMHYAPDFCAGLLLEQECLALERVLDRPHTPVVAVVGGSKVSTKCALLDHLLTKVDTLVVGGGIANTFLKAMGVEVGSSVVEDRWLSAARDLLKKASVSGKTILLPVDVVVKRAGVACSLALSEISLTDKIMDIGPLSCQKIAVCLQTAKTIIWNGPLGVFEEEDFAGGTKALIQALGQSSAYRVAGGGDSMAALAAYSEGKPQESLVDYLSTGGGAFLEYIEGKTLPGLAILKERA